MKINSLQNFFDNKVKLYKVEKNIDPRGFFSEIYNYEYLKKYNIDDIFVQDNFSYSRSKFVIRGLHFQSPPYEQCKLVRVNKGMIADVVVDIRKNSDTYGKYRKFILSDTENNQLYISSGFAHGFCTLSENTEVIYKVSKLYSPSNERTIIWNDSILNINWSINDGQAIISEKDKNGEQFSHFISPFN